MKKQIFRFFLTVISIYITIQFGSCMSDQNQKILRDHPVLPSNVRPKDYDSLFTSQVTDKLKLIISYERKGKDTVSNFLYDNKYHIQVYKLSNTYNHSLKDFLKETYDANELQVGVIYYDNQRSFIKICDKMVVAKEDLPSKVFISLYGNSAHTIIKNDSVADYWLNFKNLSIKYNPNGPQELYAETYKNVAGTIPLEITFFRKSTNLYLIFTSPKGTDNLPPKTLYSLLSK